MTGLAAAKAAIPGGVRKDARNDHAGFEFASADAIYAHCRQHLADAGLAVWQDEIECDTQTAQDARGKTVMWATAKFAMALTPDGQPPEKAEHVTVMARVTGPQTFAALRTFALKYWLRGKLLLPTGEQFEDLDAAPKETPPAPTGEWVLDDATREYSAHGSWATGRAKASDLFRLLKQDLEGPNGREIVRANWDLIEEVIPPQGVEALDQMMADVE